MPADPEPALTPDDWGPGIPCSSIPEYFLGLHWPLTQVFPPEVRLYCPLAQGVTEVQLFVEGRHIWTGLGLGWPFAGVWGSRQCKMEPGVQK